MLNDLKDPFRRRARLKLRYPVINTAFDGGFRDEAAPVCRLSFAVLEHAFRRDCERQDRFNVEQARRARARAMKRGSGDDRLTALDDDGVSTAKSARLNGLESLKDQPLFAALPADVASRDPRIRKQLAAASSSSPLSDAGYSPSPSTNSPLYGSRADAAQPRTSASAPSSLATKPSPLLSTSAASPHVAESGSSPARGEPCDTKSATPRKSLVTSYPLPPGTDIHSGNDVTSRTSISDDEQLPDDVVDSIVKRQPVNHEKLRNQDKDRVRDESRDRQRQRSQERVGDKDQDRSRNSSRARSRDRSRSKSRTRSQSTDRNVSVDRKRSRSRDRKRSRSRDRKRSRSRDRKRSRSRDRKRSRSRDRKRSRSRDRKRSRSRDRKRSRSRDRKRSRSRERKRSRSRERKRSGSNERHRNKHKKKKKKHKHRSRSPEERQRKRLKHSFLDSDDSEDDAKSKAWEDITKKYRHMTKRCSVKLPRMSSRKILWWLEAKDHLSKYEYKYNKYYLEYTNQPNWRQNFAKYAEPAPPKKKFIAESNMFGDLLSQHAGQQRLNKVKQKVSAEAPKRKVVQIVSSSYSGVRDKDLLNFAKNKGKKKDRFSSKSSSKREEPPIFDGTSSASRKSEKSKMKDEPNEDRSVLTEEELRRSSVSAAIHRSDI